MNVEIGTKATQFPEKEYINGIFLAVLNKVHFCWVGWSVARMLVIYYFRWIIDLTHYESVVSYV